MSVVRHAETFGREFLAQLSYALARGQQTWASQSIEDLAELEELLRRFPYAGTQLDDDGARTLRRIGMSRAPFMVWYTTDARADEVVFARLFHRKQRTPEPRLPD